MPSVSVYYDINAVTLNNASDNRISSLFLKNQGNTFIIYISAVYLYIWSLVRRILVFRQIHIILSIVFNYILIRSISIGTLIRPNILLLSISTISNILFRIDHGIDLDDEYCVLFYFSSSAVSYILLLFLDRALVRYILCLDIYLLK